MLRWVQVLDLFRQCLCNRGSVCVKPLVCFFIVCVAFGKLGTCVLYLSVLCFVLCFFHLYTVSDVLFTVYFLGMLVFVCIPSLLWVVFTVLGFFPCMCFTCVNKTLLLGIPFFILPLFFVFPPTQFCFQIRSAIPPHGKLAIILHLTP